MLDLIHHISITNMYFKIKLFISRIQVSRFAEANIDNLAIPLAGNKNIFQLLFTESKKIRLYCK